MRVIAGIESTAHTFGIGVVDAKTGKILSNVKDSYTTAEGGMVPMEVRAHHARVAEKVWEKGLREAGVSEWDVEAIAFSNAPGLAPCLLEGMSFVKKKAIEIGNLKGIRNQESGTKKVGGNNELAIPIIGVNHCVAHLVVGEVFGSRDPVMLYVSGANTQVIAYEGGRFRVFGETLDLGVGNFIDTIARTMGLGFPGGPKIQELAREYEKKSGTTNYANYTKKNGTQTNTDEHGRKNREQDSRDLENERFPELLELPYAVKGMDISLSGIQTKIRTLIEKGEDKERLAFALQETVFAMLVEVAERALAHTGKSELLLGGGVACNDRLVEMCRVMCEERGVKLIVPEKGLLVDNGGMIGYLGWKMWRAGMGEADLDSVDIYPRERTDEVVCDFWR